MAARSHSVETRSDPPKRQLGKRPSRDHDESIQLPADQPVRRFTRVLDPMDRISEVLFGLIMVLTYTSTLGVVTGDRAPVREMLIGALGCNLAWGIIDAG